MRRVLCTVAVLGWLGWSGAALADADLGRARDLVAEGNTLASQGKFQQALERFRAAYEISPRPRILFNIAQTELQLHQELAAAQDFSRFLEVEPAGPGPDDFRATATAAINDLSTRLGRLTVSVHPPDASRLVDGEPMRTTLQFVAPGDHVVIAAALGYLPQTRNMNVAAGARVDLVLDLQPEPSKAQAQARAQPQVPAPAPTPTPAPAKPNLALQPRSQPTPAPVVVAAPEPPRRSRTPAYVALGAAGVLVAAATAMAVVTHSEYGSLPANHTGVRTAAESTELTHARITDGLWLGAAIAGATGGYLWFRSAAGGVSAGAGGDF